MQSKFTNLIQNNKGLFWDIAEKDYSTLDEEAVIERFMAFGDMQDIHELEATISGRNLWSAFKKIRNKSRVNLQPETINFFDIYLSRYAS
ncbi:hypothetical protein GF389_05780 [Candidatus Dojkabacteria bacterium]|nr:hypothetical protein [Candidatus Dojkabacteria bacterium]